MISADIKNDAKQKIKVFIIVFHNLSQKYLLEI